MKIRILLTIFLTIAGIVAFAQKLPLISDETQVMAAAVKELDFSVNSMEGALHRFIQKNGIKGTYTFNITLRGKGQVATVFAISDENNHIKFQNLLKDQIKQYRFGFRMPKGKFYKFQYTFNL